MPDLPPLSDPAAFRWPEGIKAGLSLSFDDARLTQPDNGFAILDRHGVRATFYVVPSGVEKRLAAWKQAVAHGHEIGNHTVTHPCGGAALWSRKNALEDYTLERMEGEIDGANQQLHELLGVTPTTFAYPCGQKYVGRGENHRSYVPLVASRFLIGRGNTDPISLPRYMDLSQASHSGCDRMTFERFTSLVAQAVEQGGWLILCGHEIDAETNPDRLTTIASVLDEICRFAIDPKNQLWVDTVDAIGKYVCEQRRKAM